MKIRLTHKYSQSINGIDLSKVREGDTIEMSGRDADMLVAEGWAVVERDRAHDGARKRRTAPRTTSKKSAKKKR